MARNLIFVSFLLSYGLATSISQAQLFRGNAAPSATREPARVGLLGGLREAREERFRREEQAATAAARAAAAQRNAALAPRPNPNATPQQPAKAASNNAQRGNEKANPLAASQTSKVDPNARSANFRGPSGGDSGVNSRSQQSRGQLNSGLTNSKISPNNALSRPTPATSSAAVTSASATSFVPEPIGLNGQEYNGPGVVIRLPKESLSVVNFLVDETNTSAIRPGEQQVLDSKGSYVVRYSRGVTRDGRSFGESRYTITEGHYRFELTATGWELYRETDSDADLPPNPLDLVESPIADTRELLSSQSELQRESPNKEAESREAIANKSAAKPKVSEPPTPVANEELLPAPKPRSILE